MKGVHLTELRNQAYSLRRAIAHMQYWREGSSWLIQEGGRINTAIMAIVGLEADYVDVETENVLISAKPGDLVVIPQGIRYEFVCRKVMQGKYNLADLPCGNYYWDGVKEDRESGARIANAIFLGFEMYGDNGDSFTLGSRIHVIRTPKNGDFFQKVENIARMSGSGFTPPAIIVARMYELLTSLSESAYSRHHTSSAYQRIEPALRYLDEQPVGSVAVDDLCKVCGLSASGFRRLFRQEMGSSPMEYVQKQTLNRAIELLSVGELSIMEVAFECGFQDSLYFSRFFHKHTGQSPSSWRRDAIENSAWIQSSESCNEIN